MYDVSERFLPALSHAHGIVTRVDVLYDGETVAEDIRIIDGSVSVDRGSDTRRSLSLTIPNPADFPQLEDDHYAPYGQRLYVQQGIRFLDGSVEMVPLGFFAISDISGDVHTGPLSITAPGLESVIQAEPFDAATSTAGTATHTAFILAQLQAVVPDVSFVDLSTSGTLPLATTTYDAGSDRWAALQDVAKAIGAELYCDANGSFVLADIPDPETTPVWDVHAGDDGVMVSAEASLSADGVFNRVVVYGENAADNVPPVSGSASITDPTDPLRYGGPFGRRTMTHSSDLVTSNSRATGAATALLRQHRGRNRTVSLSAVPNPALAAGDNIRVRYANKSFDPEIHAVQAFTVPLSPVGASFPIQTMSGRTETS